MSRSPSWRNIIKKPLPMPALVWLFQGLEKMPDRTAALVAGALLERALEKAIASRLTKLKLARYKEVFDGTGPLSNFQAKIRIGFALSLFGNNCYSDLDKIRVVRNVFAHAAHNVQFNTKRIANQCNQLKTCKHPVVPAMFTLLRGLSPAELSKKDAVIPTLRNAKEKYIYTSILLYMCLASQTICRPQRSRSGFTRKYLS